MIEVAIIEDNAHFRKALVHTINLKDNMTCCNTYVSCEEALADFEKELLAPDILLMDIGLPGMSGIEGIPKIRELSPKTHIIILTIHDDHDNTFKAICAGASGYLLKDSSSDMIIRSLEDVLMGGSPMKIHIARKVLNMFRDISAPGEDYGLSDREKEILQNLTEGLSKKEIAALLHISYHTVDMHMRKIYEKLHVNNRSGAVAKALKERLI